MSAWSSCGSPSTSQMPCFHSTPAGCPASRASPTRAGFTACQMSTYGWPSTSTCRPPGRSPPTRRSGPPCCPGPGGRPAPRAGARVRARTRDDAGQLVDAAEQLDDDARRPQVVAPDLLDQLGVVPALDVDPAGQRHLGPGRDRRGDRAGGRPRSVGRGSRRRQHQGDRPALVPESRADREAAPPPLAVLEHDQTVLPAHDRADEPAGRVLDAPGRG